MGLLTLDDLVGKAGILQTREYAFQNAKTAHYNAARRTAAMIDGGKWTPYEPPEPIPEDQAMKLSVGDTYQTYQSPTGGRVSSILPWALAALLAGAGIATIPWLLQDKPPDHDTQYELRISSEEQQ